MIVDNEHFEVRDSPLGGQGSFAKKDIPKGVVFASRKHYMYSD